MADGLTPKQAAFVREYLIDRNATQAAIRAGYSAHTAEQIGYQLIQKTSVAAEIAKAESKLQSKTDITVEMVMNGLLTEANGQGVDTSPAARVAAWEKLGKQIGMFKDPKPGESADNPLYTKPLAAVPDKETESYAWQTDTAGDA
jgi:hypothetical protein